MAILTTSQANSIKCAFCTHIETIVPPDTSGLDATEAAEKQSEARTAAYGFMREHVLGTHKDQTKPTLRTLGQIAAESNELIRLAKRQAHMF